MGPPRLIPKRVEGVPVPTASGPTESAPVMVEVPRPETVRRFAILNEVELAMGKEFTYDVEVTRKPEAVRREPNRPSPETESMAPGEVVPMPKDPAPLRRAVSMRDPALSTRNWRSAVAPRARLEVMRVPREAVVVATLLTSVARKARRDAVEVAFWRLETKSGVVVAAVEFATSRLVVGLAVLMPTLPLPSMTMRGAAAPAV